jgi:hypothetical protein
MFKLSQTKYPPRVVFWLRDLDTQCARRYYEFTIAQLARPGVAHHIAGPVNSIGTADLAIESVRLDTRRVRFFTVPAPVDGAGGSAIN